KENLNFNLNVKVKQKAEYKLKFIKVKFKAVHCSVQFNTRTRLSLILCKEKLLDLAVQYLVAIMDLKEGETARCETRRKAAREKKRRQRMSQSPAHRKKANNEHQRQSRARRCTEAGIPGQGERLSTEVPRCWSVFFSVDSDEDVIEKVKIVCDLFSKVTRGHGKGAFGRDNGLCLASRVLWGFLRQGYAEKLVVEAFKEDTGLKVGSGVAENHKEEEDEDQQVGKKTGKDRNQG
ncbi:hypothetical protein THAOC_19515, partial [Thalassiosira oceanica]